MAVKLRLQRGGKKRYAFFQIVAADQRAPRDGRFIEKLGIYNPNTNPATIELNLDRAVHWLQCGAVPTDTVRAILSYKGAVYKNHLLKGVTKGALTEEQAEAKFAEWLDQKESKITGKSDRLAAAKAAKLKEDLEREASIRAAREQAILAKSAPVIEESEAASEEVAAAESVAEDTTADVAEETAGEETSAEESTEA